MPSVRRHTILGERAPVAPPLNLPLCSYFSYFIVFFIMTSFQVTMSFFPSPNPKMFCKCVIPLNWVALFKPIFLIGKLLDLSVYKCSSDSRSYLEKKSYEDLECLQRVISKNILKCEKNTFYRSPLHQSSEKKFTEYKIYGELSHCFDPQIWNRSMFFVQIT